MHALGIALAVALLVGAAILFCKGLDKVLELVDKICDIRKL